MAPRLVIAAMARPLDGLGRVLHHLADAAAGRPDVALAYVGPRKQGSLGKAARTSPAAFLREAAFRLRARGRHERTLAAAGAWDAGAVVLLHPQSFGYDRVLDVARRRTGPTWLYLMDSCWFCVRSYDHLEDELRPCLRCLGGDLASARRRGCEPFPRDGHQQEAFRFVAGLMETVRAGKLGILVQCRTQEALVRRHFGDGVRVADVGLWASDWDELVAPAPPAATGAAAGGPPYDVVFHGAPVAAKGVRFAVELARRRPELRFLVPARPESLGELRARVPANCAVEGVTWETGLRDAVRDARLVLVPSLWSAPIEGALVKSIALARAVAVVENDGAYCAELPPGLCVTLPADLDRAAEALAAALAAGFAPPPEARRAFAEGFAARHRNLLERLLAAAAPTGGGN